MHSLRKLGVLVVIAVIALVFGAANAASSASITFDLAADPGDFADGPVFGVHGTAGLTDDGAGCDAVAVVIVDATGTISDIDTICLDLGTGLSGSDGDYGSTGGYLPVAGPATYGVFDLTAADLAALSGLGDGDPAYGAYVVANCAFLAESHTDIPGLTSGAPYSFAPAPAPASPAASGPGPDMVPIPDTAVVGSFVVTTPIYFAAREGAVSDVLMEAGKTVWVYGVDESGLFYKVMLSGKFFWVPVATMGPNFDAVWQGRALPTVVVH